MEDHSYIISVLTDLENYADKNGLTEMRKAIDQARVVAQVELGLVAKLDIRPGRQSAPLKPG